MQAKEIQTALDEIGWAMPIDGRIGPRTHLAVQHFQEGWLLGAPLSVDGDPGPKTQKALADCLAYRGRCSDHFWFREFKSNGNGWIRVRRELVAGLEKLRAIKGRPLEIISGYRDPAHNALVGGATGSRHLVGEAADIPSEYGLTYDDVFSTRSFTGMGIVRATKRVAHVDVGGVPYGSSRAGRGTVVSPTVWFYG